MTTLAADTPRAYEADIDPEFNDLPVVASDVIYEGAAVGDNGSGYCRPLVAADPFRGFCDRRCDNGNGSAGDLNVRLRQRGAVQLSVAGASAVTDVDSTVYASDDNTFTLTSDTNTPIGKVKRWVTGTICIVQFEAEASQSL